MLVVKLNKSMETLFPLACLGNSDVFEEVIEKGIFYYQLRYHNNGTIQYL